jgi:hypothetical protein
MCFSDARSGLPTSQFTVAGSGSALKLNKIATQSKIRCFGKQIAYTTGVAGNGPDLKN